MAGQVPVHVRASTACPPRPGQGGQGDGSQPADDQSNGEVIDADHGQKEADAAHTDHPGGDDDQTLLVPQWHQVGRAGPRACDARDPILSVGEKRTGGRLGVNPPATGHSQGVTMSSSLVHTVPADLERLPCA